MKFWLKVLLVWIIVIAATVTFSKRDRFTFVFEGEDLPQFVIGEDEAKHEEEEAESLKNTVQVQAAKRNYAGIYEGIGILQIEDAHRAMDNGLNLMWGTYDVVLNTNESKTLTCRMICPGKQSFIRGGTAEGAPEDGSLTFSFTVTDAADHIKLCVNDPGNVSSVTVVKRGTTTIDHDLLGYLSVLGILATVMVALGEGLGLAFCGIGQTSRHIQAQGQMTEKDVWGEKRALCRKQQQTMFLLIVMIVFASAPLFWRGIYNGHDLMFHVNRIEGIAAALRQGQFPVRIHASTIYGYGYASSEFYPELFLYFPAVLRNLGVTMAAVIRIFVFMINAATAVSCYFGMKILTGRRDTALGATGLYMLSIYRLVNLYTRATYGESLAMIFFPLLIAAMAEVLTGNVKRWPLLALSMVGIACSHLLSTLFSVVLCAAAAVICLPKLIKEPKRIGAILGAAGLTLVCCIGFFVPMIDYVNEGINTNVSLLPQRSTLTLGSYLIGFAGNKGEVAPEAEDYAYSIGVIPGLALVAGMTLFLLWKFSDNTETKSDGNKRLERIGNVLMIFGVGLLLMATDLAPWEKISNMRMPFSAIAQQMQFPWRLVGMAVPMLSVPAALGYLKNDRWRNVGAAVMVVLGILPAAYTMQCKIEEEPLIYPDSYTTSYIGQSEYLYLFTDNEALWPGDLHLKGIDPREITAYQKDGTNLTFTIRTTPGDHVIDLPLLYYKGYRAEGTGCDEIELVRGTNNVIQLNVRNMSEESSFHIWFEPPVIWTVASLISGFGIIVLCILAALCNRGQRQDAHECLNFGNQK